MLHCNHFSWFCTQTVKDIEILTGPGHLTSYMNWVGGGGIWLFICVPYWCPVCPLIIKLTSPAYHWQHLHHSTSGRFDGAQLEEPQMSLRPTHSDKEKVDQTKKKPVNSTWSHWASQTLNTPIRSLSSWNTSCSGPGISHCPLWTCISSSLTPFMF